MPTTQRERAYLQGVSGGGPDVFVLLQAAQSPARRRFRQQRRAFWREAPAARVERRAQLHGDQELLQLGQHAVRVSWLERSIKRKSERDETLRAATEVAASLATTCCTRGEQGGV